MLKNKKFEKFKVKVDSICGGASEEDCQNVYANSWRESCYNNKTSKYTDWSDGVVTNGGTDSGSCSC